MQFYPSFLAAGLFAALASALHLEIISEDGECKIQVGTPDAPDYGCYGTTAGFAPDVNGDCSQFSSGADVAGPLEVCTEYASVKITGKTALFTDTGIGNPVSIPCDFDVLNADESCDV
ncbi:hypothetical protein N7462_009413 [Penicillium macrosclerotiorum]|uniref:uncharacterized protein n=1 Tax=Penicillium macrosclerotiorum TaxID=303699 RepID=UPI002547DFDA|nr:uncharacterized protein N7462_009413 [Penicillium macrosclerotiorum]KAJ5673974.1 hypothetical protein N7462_009413 [Penicillium macrosclerotiorum]